MRRWQGKHTKYNKNDIILSLNKKVDSHFARSCVIIEAMREAENMVDAT